MDAKEDPKPPWSPFKLRMARTRSSNRALFYFVSTSWRAAVVLNILMPKEFMITSLSPEGRIRSGLRRLTCTENSFVKISQVVGRTRFVQGITDGPDQKDFDRDDAERMLEILGRMDELQEAAIAPIDWAQTDRVRTALTIRLAAKIEREDYGSNQLDAAASAATKKVTA
jgi:hypothetical protein